MNGGWRNSTGVRVSVYGEWGRFLEDMTYLVAVQCVEFCVKLVARVHRVPPIPRLLHRHLRQICKPTPPTAPPSSAPLTLPPPPRPSIPAHPHHSPIPTYSSVFAFAHFGRSPPLPQPMSRTLMPGRRPFACGPGRASGGPAAWANLEMRTDFVQLLNFLRPMMGESWRAETSTLGRALSAHDRIRGGVSLRRSASTPPFGHHSSPSAAYSATRPPPHPPSTSCSAPLRPPSPS